MCLSMCGDLENGYCIQNSLTFTGIENMQNSEGLDLSCEKDTASQIYFWSN